MSDFLSEVRQVFEKNRPELSKDMRNNEDVFNLIQANLFPFPLTHVKDCVNELSRSLNFLNKWWCLGSSATRYEGACDKWA